MLLEILFFMALGIGAGTITGLVPGIHINTVGALLITLSQTVLSSLHPLYLLVLIVAMAITHTFLDFIPATLLGCPDTDTELSLLPGHQFLVEGKGLYAIYLTSYGSLFAIFITLCITPFAILFLPTAYAFIKTFIPYLLILTIIILIFTEKHKISAVFVLILTGILGYLVLNIGLKEPLMPLLTGLFGGSVLITSFRSTSTIPKQDMHYDKIKDKSPLLGAAIAAPLCSFLPGLGSGQAAILGSAFIKNTRENFLILVGAINTIVMGFSFVALYTIDRTRTGAAVAIKDIFGAITPQYLVLILITVLIVGIIGFFLVDILSKRLVTFLSKFNYGILSRIVFFFLVILTFLLSGFLGLLVFFVTSFTGIFCLRFKSRRTNMMGCLLLPTILLYLA